MTATLAPDLASEKTSAQTPAPQPANPKATTPEREQFLRDHVRALDFSGYTVVPGQLDEDALLHLRRMVNNAVYDHRDAFANGLDFDAITYDKGHNKPVRNRPDGWWETFNRSECTYLWGIAGYELLDHPVIHEIARRAMHGYQLLDVMMNGSWRPKTGNTWGWHRDHSRWMIPDGTRHDYLWCFFLLDDFTKETGGTWVVPGSHRLRHNEKLYWDETYDGTSDHYPSKIQVEAKAGDLMIVDPNTLHSSGFNYTDQPRRTLNVRIASRTPGIFRPHANHYALVPEEHRQYLTSRAAGLLKSDYHDLDDTYAVPVKHFYDGTPESAVPDLDHL